MTWTMSDIGRTGIELEVDRLAFVLRSLQKRFRPIDELLSFALATEMLDFFFGRPWTNENVHRPHPHVSRVHRSGRAFLGTDSDIHRDKIRYQRRVVELAELCFNLQRVPGFRQRLAKLQTTDLEAAYGELRCSALFAEKSLGFQFIAESGIKGQDYEGEFQTALKQIVCCEMKTKLASTDLSSGTILSSIRKACRQLPPDRPGVVCMWIPEAWVHTAEIKCAVEEALRKAFESQRIVAVLFVWQECHQLAEGWAFITKWRPYANNESKNLSDDVQQALTFLGVRKNAEWFHVQQFVTASMQKNYDALDSSRDSSLGA